MLYLSFLFTCWPCAYLSVAEVLARPLSGPLDSLGVARASCEAAGSEVTLAHGGVAEEAGKNQPVVSVAPVSPAALVAAVAGVKEVLYTQLDGLNGLAEASCQVRPPFVG